MWPIQNCFLLYDKPLLRPLVQPKLRVMRHEWCAWKIRTTHNIQWGSSGPGQLSRYSESLRTGLSGIESRCGTRFSAPVQTGLVPTHVLGWNLPQFTAPTDGNSSRHTSPNFQPRFHSTHPSSSQNFARTRMFVSTVICCPVKGSSCHARIFNLRSPSAGRTVFPNTPNYAKQNCYKISSKVFNRFPS